MTTTTQTKLTVGEIKHVESILDTLHKSDLSPEMDALETLLYGLCGSCVKPELDLESIGRVVELHSQN
jgi:hypothetical protein